MLEGFTAAHGAAEGDLAVTGDHLGIHALGMSAPQQLGLDRRRGAGIVDGIAEAAFAAGFARGELSIDDDVVGHRIDAADAERDLIGQFLVGFFGHSAAQRRLAIVHRNLEVAGAQIGADGVGGRDLAFLSCLGDVLGHVFR